MVSVVYPRYELGMDELLFCCFFHFEELPDPCFILDAGSSCFEADHCDPTIGQETAHIHQAAPLLTWINFNPSVDK